MRTAQRSAPCSATIHLRTWQVDVQQPPDHHDTCSGGLLGVKKHARSRVAWAWVRLSSSKVVGAAGGHAHTHEQQHDMPSAAPPTTQQQQQHGLSVGNGAVTGAVRPVPRAHPAPAQQGERRPLAFLYTDTNQ